MVHFMFVNRTSNVMVAPSFHVNLYADEDRTHHTSELVKQKVWVTIQSCFIIGNLSTYNYFIQTLIA